MFDIVNLLFKNHEDWCGGGDRRPNVVGFVVWSVLIAAEWWCVRAESHIQGQLKSHLFVYLA